MTKKLFFIILFALTKFSFSQDNNANLDETTAWLQSKLNFYYYDNLDNKTKLDVAFDKKTKSLTVTRTTKLKDSENLKISVTTIPMKDIDPNNIQVKEDVYNPGNYWLILKVNNAQFLIKWKTKQVGKPTDLDNFLHSEKDIQFYIPKNEIARNDNLHNRLKTSFIHLIKLCGGKGEKF